MNIGLCSTKWRANTVRANASAPAGVATGNGMREVVFAIDKLAQV